MNLEDPRVIILCKAVLALLALLLLFVSSLSLTVVVDMHRTNEQGPGNAILVRLSEILPALSASPDKDKDGKVSGQPQKQAGSTFNEAANILAIVVSALPLVVTAVCFVGVGAEKRLNKFGFFLASTLLVVCLLASTGYLMLKPVEWSRNYGLDLQGFLNLQDWAKTALRGAVFYLAAIFGLKAAH